MGVNSRLAMLARSQFKKSQQFYLRWTWKEDLISDQKMELTSDVSEMQARLVEAMSDTIKELNGAWHKMGLPKEMFDNRVKAVESEVKALFNVMTTEEKLHIKKLYKEIDKWRHDRISLAEELGIQLDDSETVDETVGLVALQNDLRLEVQRLMAIKIKAIKELRDLVDQDRKLCAFLEEEEFSISTSVVPSDSQIKELKQHISQMEGLKRQRVGQFHELKTEITAIYEELETEPETTFARHLVCEMDDAAFKFSASNVALVEMLLTQLKQLRASKIREAQELRQRISNLADKLNVAEEYRLGEMRYTSSALSELKETLHGLEQLKLSKLEEFIKATRLELEEWWERCYYGEAQRLQFRPFYETQLDQGVLEQLEAELGQIKQHYQANVRLFSLVEECQNLWKTKLRVDNCAKDPTRLGDYKRLAQEEKDRIQVKKRLPKLEQQLFESIAAYEQQHGKDFLVGGLPFKQYWSEQKEQHEIDLEQEKTARKVQKRMQMDHEARFGASRTPLTPAAGSRKLNLKRKQNDATVAMATSSANLLGQSKRMALDMKNTLSATARQTTMMSSHDKNSSIQAGSAWPVKRSARLMNDHIDHTAFFPGNIVSSTLTSEHEALCHLEQHRPSTRAPSRRLFQTPTRTPSVFKTPVSSAFRTPSSSALTPVNGNRNRTLRSGKTFMTPF